jgi:hypothetical protein
MRDYSRKAKGSSRNRGDTISEPWIGRGHPRVALLGDLDRYRTMLTAIGLEP